jgi:hypothetical protein
MNRAGSTPNTGSAAPAGVRLTGSIPTSAHSPVDTAAPRLAASSCTPRQTPQYGSPAAPRCRSVASPAPATEDARRRRRPSDRPSRQSPHGGASPAAGRRRRAAPGRARCPTRAARPRTLRAARTRCAGGRAEGVSRRESDLSSRPASLRAPRVRELGRGRNLTISQLSSHACVSKDGWRSRDRAGCWPGSPHPRPAPARTLRREVRLRTRCCCRAGASTSRRRRAGSPSGWW